MTKIKGHFRKEKQEKKDTAGKREMVEDAVSKDELERIERHLKNAVLHNS